MITVRACLYDQNGDPVKLMEAEPHQLNINLRAGWTWRQVPADCETSNDAPELEHTSKHPELKEVN